MPATESLTSTTAIARFRGDLSLVAENIIGAKLSGHQRDLLQALSRPRARVADRTGHGIGKTYAAALAVLSFLPLYPGSRVITTAPTFPQVRDLLWAEIGKLHRMSTNPLGGRPNITRWELARDWFAVGLSTDESDRIQGRHAPHVLVVFDEASGVRPEIWEAGEAIMAGSDVRWLAIGNPLNPRGDFAKCFADPRWHCLHCSSWDAPNVTGELDIPGGVTREWCEEMLAKWGKDSPLYKARVLGEFPEDEEDAIIPLSWIARSRALPPIIGNPALPVLGVDVARKGSDNSVYVVRAGAEILHTAQDSKKLTTHVVGHALRIAARWKVAPRDICVDDTGVGGGVTDGLTERLGKVTAVNFGSRAVEPDRFANRVAELYWLLREALDPGRAAPPRLRLPAGDDVSTELSRLYGLDSKGRITLESKDDFKKRIGRSPDKADALALTYARASRGGERAGYADLDLATHVARTEGNKWTRRRDPDREEIEAGGALLAGGDFGEPGDMSGF